MTIQNILNTQHLKCKTTSTHCSEYVFILSLVEVYSSNWRKTNNKQTIVLVLLKHISAWPLLQSYNELTFLLFCSLTPEANFLGFKFLLLDRLSKALAQLFLVCEHIFWHWLSDVIGDDVIAKSHAICVLAAKSLFFARNLLNTYNFTMDSTYFVDFNR